MLAIPSVVSTVTVRGFASFLDKIVIKRGFHRLSRRLVDGLVDWDAYSVERLPESRKGHPDE